MADLLTPVILVYLGGGQVNTVRAWLDRLGDESVAADPRLCLVAGAGPHGARRRRRRSPAGSSAPTASIAGPLPGGPASIEAGVATVRGIVTSGRLSHHLEAGRARSTSSASDPTIWRPLAFGCHGTALYWNGDSEEARPYIEVAARSPAPLLVCAAYGFLGMMAANDGDTAAADHYSTEGERLGEEHKLLTSPPYGRVPLARGRAAGFAEHWPRASRAWKRPPLLLRSAPFPLDLADALLWLARARQLAGSPDSAGAALGEARLVLEQLPELGILAERWQTTERLLGGDQPDVSPAARVPMDELSARERDVLQMLPTALIGGGDRPGALHQLPHRSQPRTDDLPQLGAGAPRRSSAPEQPACFRPRSDKAWTAPAVTRPRPPAPRRRRRRLSPPW